MYKTVIYWVRWQPLIKSLLAWFTVNTIVGTQISKSNKHE